MTSQRLATPKQVKFLTDLGVSKVAAKKMTIGRASNEIKKRVKKRKLKGKGRKKKTKQEILSFGYKGRSSGRKRVRLIS